MLEVYKPHTNCEAVGVLLCSAAKLPTKRSALVINYLRKKTDKYTHHSIQNECLTIIPLNVIRILSCFKSNGFYTIMADFVTDSSNREQVFVCFQ